MGKSFFQKFKEDSISDKIIAICTSLLVLFNCIFIAFGYKQSIDTAKSVAIADSSMRINKKNVEIYEKTSQIENRAFIQVNAPASAGLVISPTTLKVTQVQVNIINTGKTPAYNVKCFVTVSEDSAKDPISIKFENIMDGGTLGANQSNELRDTVNISFTKYYDRKKNIYFYGKLTYDDFFGKSHFTHFNFHIIPSSRHTLSIKDIGKMSTIYQPMSAYNDAN